ncbi:hypothetical protein TraAM80_09690, partial [Trypanosoma rangeli]
VMRPRPGIMTVLMPHSVLLPSAVEGYAIDAFMYGDFARRIRDKLSELRPLIPAGGCGPRPCLLQMNPPLCPTDAVALPPKVLHPGRTDAMRRVQKAFRLWKSFSLLRHRGGRWLGPGNGASEEDKRNRTFWKSTARQYHVAVLYEDVNAVRGG